MKTLILALTCLVSLSVFAQPYKKNRFSTNDDAATIHGDTLDQLKADKLATGVADIHRLASGGSFDANHFLNGLGQLGAATPIGGNPSTNLVNYGNFTNVGTNNSDGVIEIDDPGGTPVAGFDTNKGGWYGPGLVWSNYNGFIFPAGDPAPDVVGRTLPGPGFFYRIDGSFFGGTNVVQDVNAADMTTLYSRYVTLMNDSNEPPFFNEAVQVINNENYDSWAGWDLQVFRSDGAPYTAIKLFSQPTNGAIDSIELASGLADLTSTHFWIKTNSVKIFNINSNGLVTANGFTDNSGPADNSLAISGSGGRIKYTNSIAGLAGQLWGTNSTTGAITNLNGGGVSVGNGGTAVAGSITLNAGTGTGGVFDYSGATHSNEVMITSSAGREVSLANGGANTFLQGTTPPTYTGIANAALSNSTVTVNGTANHITTTSASIALGGSATLDVGSSVDLIDVAQTISASKAFTASNYQAAAQGIYTNANNTTPDFNVLSSTLSTNNNFKWLPPTHLDTSGKVEQWIITHVTNSSGSTINMTAPDNVHVCGGGANNVTNWTEVRWQYIPPSGPTNYWASPGY